MSRGWYCYCLLSETNTTYIGATIDPDRRLRQHNRELSGGAKATGRSEGWKRVCCVTGFPDERSALQFEWKWKHLSKRYKGAPLEKRFKALEELLNAEQTTSQALPFSSYDAPLCLYLEDPSCETLKHKDFRYAIVEEV
jgi:predicted GIY-YIG superfamily endonuclease